MCFERKYFGSSTFVVPLQVKLEKVLFHTEMRAQNTVVNALLFQITASLVSVLDCLFLFDFTFLLWCLYGIYHESAVIVGIK